MLRVNVDEGGKGRLVSNEERIDVVCFRVVERRVRGVVDTRE